MRQVAVIGGGINIKAYGVVLYFMMDKWMITNWGFGHCGNLNSSIKI